MLVDRAEPDASEHPLCHALSAVSFEKGSLASELVEVHPLSWLNERFPGWDSEMGWLGAAYAHWKVPDPRPLKAALEGLTPEERKGKLANPEGTPAPPPSKEADSIQRLLDLGKQNQSAIINAASKMSSASGKKKSSSSSSNESEESEEEEVQPKALFDTPANTLPDGKKRTRKKIATYEAGPADHKSKKKKKVQPVSQPATVSTQRPVRATRNATAGKCGVNTEAVGGDTRHHQALKKEKEENEALKFKVLNLQSQMRSFEVEKKSNSILNEVAQENRRLKNCIKSMYRTAKLLSRDKKETCEELDECLKENGCPNILSEIV